MAVSPPAETEYVEGLRHGLITVDDVGPIITIVTILFMVIMVLAVALRLLVRFTASHVPGMDDVVVSVALLVAIGEVIAISLTVNHGLGTRTSLLAMEQSRTIAKGLYTANLLYLVVIALGKASTLLLLNRLTISGPHKRAVKTIAAVIIMWFITAILGAAFQCHLPDPWLVEPDRCLAIDSFWYVVGSSDIIIDVILFALPAWVVWNLQMSWRRKLVVVTGFAFRFSLSAAQTVRLACLDNSKAENPYMKLGYILATQFQATFAVVVACIPAYKSFMDRAASGLIGVSFEHRGGTYQLSSTSRSIRNSARSGSRKQSVPVAGANGACHVEISADDVDCARGRVGSASQHAHKTVE